MQPRNGQFEGLEGACDVYQTKPLASIPGKDHGHEFEVTSIAAIASSRPSSDSNQASSSNNDAAGSLPYEVNASHLEREISRIVPHPSQTPPYKRPAPALRTDFTYVGSYEFRWSLST